MRVARGQDLLLAGQSGQDRCTAGPWQLGQAMYVGEALNVCYEEYKKEGEEIVFVCVISGPKPSVTERSIRCRCSIWP